MPNAPLFTLELYYQGWDEGYHAALHHLSSQGIRSRIDFSIDDESQDDPAKSIDEYVTTCPNLRIHEAGKLRGYTWSGNKEWTYSVATPYLLGGEVITEEHNRNPNFVQGNQNDDLAYQD